MTFGPRTYWRVVPASPRHAVRRKSTKARTTSAHLITPRLLCHPIPPRFAQVVHLHLRGINGLAARGQPHLGPLHVVWTPRPCGVSVGGAGGVARVPRAHLREQEPSHGGEGGATTRGGVQELRRIDSTGTR